MPKGIYNHSKIRNKRRDTPWLIGNTNGFKKGYIPNNYKGDRANYLTKHQWVYYHFGKADRCENKNCGYTNPKRYDWANLSGKYLRKREDWIRLCPSCHKKMDWKPKMICKNGHKLKGNNLWINNRGNRVCKKCKAIRAKETYERDRQKVIDRVNRWRLKQKTIKR